MYGVCMNIRQLCSCRCPFPVCMPWKPQGSLENEAPCACSPPSYPPSLVRAPPPFLNLSNSLSIIHSWPSLCRRIAPIWDQPRGDEAALAPPTSRARLSARPSPVLSLCRLHAELQSVCMQVSGIPSDSELQLFIHPPCLGKRTALCEAFGWLIRSMASAWCLFLILLLLLTDIGLKVLALAFKFTVLYPSHFSSILASSLIWTRLSEDTLWEKVLLFLFLFEVFVKSCRVLPW